MNIGEAIKEMRTDRRLSQKELAEKATISQNALCNIEKGSSFPSKDTIMASLFVNHGRGCAGGEESYLQCAERTDDKVV